jgi:hypothetical protein
MNEMIEQRPTRREVLPYNGIRANTQPLCPEFWDQLEATDAAIASGAPEFANIPTDRPRVGLLVTITDFNVATNAPIRAFGGLESDFPFVIASMGDVEQAVVNADDFGEIVLNAAMADAWTGNTLRSQFVAGGRVDNPILDAAWEDSMTSSRSATGDSQEAMVVD